MIKPCLFASAVVLLAGLAHADSDYLSPTNERVRVSLGGVRVSTTTTLRVDSAQGVPGSSVNAEDDLGLDSSDFEPKFQAMVRVATRHRLSFDYFTLDRTGNATLAKPINFRDVLLIPTDPVQTKLSLRTLGITYGYSFWHGEKLELAATLGVHATDISARAKVQTATRHVDQSEDHAGPIPTLGLDSTWVISKRFYIDGRFQYLKVNVSDIDGSLGLYELNALYRYRPNVAFAIGYSMVKAQLTSNKTSEAGVFDFNTKGPQAFVRIAF